MKKRYSAMAFLLAASLVVPATAQAAGPGVSIYWDRSKDSAQIYLTGLTDNITGAELSLTSKQDLSQVAFSAGKDIAYAYAAKENGGMTIYVDSIAPLQYTGRPNLHRRPFCLRQRFFFRHIQFDYYR